MARPCTICSHAQRADIDRAIANGTSLRDIAGQFGIAKSVVFRHRTHIADRVAAANHLAETVLQAETVDVVAELGEALRLARSGIPWARQQNDVRGYFAGIGRLVDILALFEPRLKTVGALHLDQPVATGELDLDGLGAALEHGLQGIPGAAEAAAQVFLELDQERRDGAA
jgi:hypothetical protein